MDKTFDDADWFSEDTATFGDRLAAARSAAGLSQKALAQRLGVKAGTLRNWEDDLSEPRANRLSMLGGILGVSLGWLLSGEGEGLEAPEEAGQEAPDVTAVLSDLRVVRAQIGQANERLALLEKRLKALGK
ncbi:helix-turn-helix domain-containing protein [Pseudooctadecabacter jejudonensis]